MNDEETVALVAGGHTFGKCHGAASPGGNVGEAPEGGSIEEQGLGWKNIHGSGKGNDTITSGIEGAWTADPVKWDNGYFHNLFEYDWELVKSPAGAYQWKPRGTSGENTVPMAHGNGRTHPIMTTADLALRFDPVYERISRRFYQDPAYFADVFAKAWYKLTHRDMGPYARCLGPLVPPPQAWQDPIPALSHPVVQSQHVQELKAILLQKLSVTQLVTTAWAAASTFRSSDMRGGINGARLRLKPQSGWAVNDPHELQSVLRVLHGIQEGFNGKCRQRQVSMADLIALCGCAGVEEATRRAGFEVVIPFTAGRTDASQENTDVVSFQAMEPIADGFRNYLVQTELSSRPEELLIDRANLLSLTAPEMTVLLGGLRVLGVGSQNTSSFTKDTGTLSNDFFCNLLDMSTEWKPSNDLYIGTHRSTGQERYRATRVDLIFGSHAVLRALSEVYASDLDHFLTDFCTAWTKAMNLDLECVSAGPTKASL